MTGAARYVTRIRETNLAVPLVAILRAVGHPGAPRWERASNGYMAYRDVT
jgi:hypothetical protein